VQFSLVSILVLVFSVVVHEVAHGWSALRLGDTTARDHGRLTLNPISHIDPVGSILVPVILAFSGGFMYGWAKPVPVRVGRLDNPRNDHPKVAAAGPLSNLLLALLSAVLLGLTFLAGRLFLGPAFYVGLASHPALDFLTELLGTAISINVVLAMFNLVPLPPMDGSWIVTRFLSPAARVRYENLRRYGMLLPVAFILLVRYTPLGAVFTPFIMVPVHALANLALAIGRLGL